ncbi:hypothetical protein C8N46_112134 [Kordia periserrulae]|uniref:Uncharacterized protein n=1 Tax=Kordia periserrulae TaxID=701523 RepID=A0A2T6BS06_9FLAO|nr:hypothetical protein C8N46_112134 [Kordia periserrulae]
MYLFWTIFNFIFIIIFSALVLTVIAKGKKVFLQKYSIATVVIMTVGIISCF